jgi:hypothetical protein
MERIDFQVNEEDRRDIVKRTYKFALRILYIVNKLPKNVVTYRIIDQLVGCGTSPSRCQLHPRKLVRRITS